MVWLILFYVIKLIIVFGFHDCCSLMHLGKLRLWIMKEHKSIFFNGLIEQLQGAELVLLIVASIQLSTLAKNKDNYTFAMSDVLMALILVMYLVFYFCQINLILNNYAALMKKESKASRMFGNFVKDINLKKQSKIVVLLTSFNGSIENLMLTWILTRA